VLTVFNIQRYSLHDGNGIRTNIFFKGCPLHCPWCNNPESLDPFPSIMFDERLCRAFGDCIRAGEGYILSHKGRLFIDRKNFTDFSRLRDVCPSKALSVCGKVMSINEILYEIEKDIPFYRISSGGVTITGGEPFAQNKLLVDLLREIKKRGIHIAAETSLNVPWVNIERCLDLVDVFLADLKHIDSVKLAGLTGGNVTLIMDNFRNIDEKGKPIVVRVPVVPDFNFSENELYGIIDFAADLKNAEEINFIPFHSLAREKYLLLGREYTFNEKRNVDKAELLPFITYAEKKGLKTKILN
jgi:pyruvate formate lyase activating enzyme